MQEHLRFSVVLSAMAAHLLAEFVDHVLLLCLQPGFQVHLLLDQLLQDAHGMFVSSTAAEFGVAHSNQPQASHKRLQANCSFRERLYVIER
jgi:hypothetical protein